MAIHMTFGLIHRIVKILRWLMMVEVKLALIREKPGRLREINQPLSFIE